MLINNAALAGEYSKPLAQTQDSDFDAILAVNLRGPFLLCRAAIRQMLTQPLRGDARGRIVNITSQHGMVGAPGHFAYAVSKGGLVQLTRQIAVEHAGDGIICNAVAPGKIVTGTPGDLSQSEDTSATSGPARRLRGLASRAMSRRRSPSWPPTTPRTSAASTSWWTAAGWPTDDGPGPGGSPGMPSAPTGNEW